MKIKTSELTGAAFDWAVHVALNGSCEGYAEHEYSTDWKHGGPIIEREGIGLDQYADYPQWQAFTPAPEQQSGQAVCNGPTPLIAAMRCYVASKLGDTVEIPEELDNLQRC
jgi:hypothetical protein